MVSLCSRLLPSAFLLVASLSAADSALLFNKTYAGTGNDYVSAVATDSSANVIFGGTTTSYDFPVTDGSRNTATHFAASANEGVSWSPLSNLPAGQPWSLAVDASKPPVWWATGTLGLFKSTDGGATWTETGPRGLPKCPSVGPNCSVYSLAIDPAQPSILYARSSIGILKTTDAGATWFVLPQPDGLPLAPGWITLDPFHPDHVFAGFSSFHFRSFDGGQTWTQFTPPILHSFCSSGYPPLAFDYVTPDLVYMADNCTFFRSTDGGIYWDPVTVPDDVVVDAITHPTRSGSVYAMTSTGIYASSDRGDTWALLLPYQRDYFPRFFVIDPANPATILTDTQQSQDGGATWTRLALGRDPLAIAFDPAHVGRAVAATSGGAGGFLTKTDSAGTVLSATYFGGQGGAKIIGVATDAGSNIYVTGSTYSPDFPTTSGAFQTAPPFATLNYFAAKFDPNLKLVYSTYLPGFVTVTSIAVDPAGSAVIAGMNPPAPGRQWQCVVVKLQPDGSGVVYSTMFGGSNGGNCASVAADPAGNAVVAGLTMSTDFPLVGNGMQTSRPGDSHAFVTKLDPGGNLVYSGYLGGSGHESASAVATDSAGNIYVAGTTASTDFPTSSGAFQTSLSSHCAYPSSAINTGIIGTITSYDTNDAFVTKLDPSGNLVFSTYLGGGCFDTATGMAVDPQGNVWITGNTQSNPFPQVRPFESGPPYSFYKAFVSELDAGGGSLRLSSYISAGHQPAIAVDNFGDAYIAGSTVPPQSPYGGYPFLPPIPVVDTHATLAKVQPQFPAPVVINSVGNAFALRDGPVSPGQITLVTAEGIAPANPQDLTLTPGGPLPRTLGDTQVLFDGEAAALVSVAAGRAVAIAPYDLAGKRQTAVRVVFQGTMSAPVVADVLADPSYLSADGSGTGQALALNPDGTVNSVQNPAPHGSMVTVYVTGVGTVDPGCPEGGVATNAGGKPPTSVPGYVCGVFQTPVQTLTYAASSMILANSALTIALK